MEDALLHPGARLTDLHTHVVVGEVRSVPFELIRSETDGDGLTLVGYAAVFNKPTRIQGWEGDFDEVITRGAFASAIEARTPVLMFEHGQHPLLGSMPLGVIRDIHEDDRGLYVRARLSDNWLIQPVRDAVRDGAVDGMSFRFSVNEDGEDWESRPRQRRLRTITQFASVPELGPVVFPAYEPTTVAVRSLIDNLAAREPGTRSAGSGEDKPSGNDGLYLARARSRALRLSSFRRRL